MTWKNSNYQPWAATQTIRIVVLLLINNWQTFCCLLLEYYNIQVTFQQSRIATSGGQSILTIFDTWFVQENSKYFNICPTNEMARVGLNYKIQEFFKMVQVCHHWSFTNYLPADSFVLTWRTLNNFPSLYSLTKDLVVQRSFMPSLWYSPNSSPGDY